MESVRDGGHEWHLVQRDYAIRDGAQRDGQIDQRVQERKQKDRHCRRDLFARRRAPAASTAAAAPVPEASAARLFAQHVADSPVAIAAVRYSARFALANLGISRGGDRRATFVAIRSGGR